MYLLARHYLIILFAEQTLPARPSLGARLLVGIFRIGSFAGAHEAVSRAFVGHNVVGLAGGLHLCDGIGDHRANARVISGVEAVDRRLDARHRVFIRWRAVENKSGRQVGAISGKAESLAATPTKAANKELAVRGGNLH